MSDNFYPTHADMSDDRGGISDSPLTPREMAHAIRARRALEQGMPLNDAEKRVIGIYRKFEVSRTDGSSESGRKHENCQYFVLDLTHDKFSKTAITAYADACESEYPELARDLRETVGRMK